jgi:hypothetical protein
MVSDSGLNGGSGCGFNDFKQITIWEIMLRLKYKVKLLSLQ